MAIGGKSIAGLLLSIGSAQAIIAIIIAQSLYPKYSALQYLSDLGVGSTAPIFNISLIVLGITSIASAYFIKKSLKISLFPILLAGFGIFAAGVGLFPETTGLPHVIFALLTFTDGAALAILSSRIVKSPAGYFFMALGVISLASLALGLTGHQFGLGVGGIERIVAYPLFIWAICFGGYLLAGREK